MRSSLRLGVFVFALACLPSRVLADPITIDFDGFADSDILTNQVAGLTFANAAVLTAGISLNEFEFPPLSGSNVAFDAGGAMTIAFASPIDAFSGHFTYLTPLTVTATSSFLSNLVLSGDAGSLPNELLALVFSGGISRVVIAGDPAGGSFTLD